MGTILNVTKLRETVEDIERITAEMMGRIAVDGYVTYRDQQTAKALLADPSLDFERDDALSIAILIAVADGEAAEARQYVDAMASLDDQWRYGIRAQAESRIFGYLDARGARPKE